MLTYLAQDWDAFDAWCLVRGIDTGALTSRRAVHLALAQLTEGADPERNTAFLAEMERIGISLLEPATVQDSSIPDVAPPPGWKSDAENWAGIQATLGSLGAMKGAIHRG